MKNQNKQTFDIMPSESISRIESRINEVFTMAEICGWHSSKLNDVLMERIINPINHKTASGKRRHSVWLAGYVSGYIASKRNDIWRNKVEFCYEYNGELYSTHKESKHKTTQEFYDRNEGYILSGCKGAHYWKGTNKPFSGNYQD